MGRLVKVLLLIIVLAAAGLAIAVATFDADRFRPQLIAELEKATGQSVTLQRVTLGWRGGVALQLNALTIADRAAPAQEPLLRVEQASAVVRLLPLLRREVQIASVVLTRPEVRVSRDTQGRINLVGLAVAGSPAAASVSPSPASTGAAVQVAIASVKVTDGQVHWTDALRTPIAELTLRDIDATIQDLVPGEPFHVEARLVLLGDQQNLQVTARVQPPSGADPGALENTRLELELGKIRWDEAARMFPALAQGGLKRAEGTLVIAVARLPLSPQGLAAAEAGIHLTNGRKEFVQFSQPVEAIHFEATLAAGRAQIKEATARVAGGTMLLRGMVEGLGQPVLHSVFQATFERIPLELLQPRLHPQDPYVRAMCSLTLEGTAQGPVAQLLASLTGQGRVSLQDPVLVNLNVLREVFRKLSMLPGLMQRLQSRLPPEYQQKLEAADTVFESFDTGLRLEGGAIHFNRVPLRSDTFSLESSGLIAWQGGVNIRSMLSIDPALSAALISSVNELQHLTTAQGVMELPLVIEGQAPRVAVLPDVGYVASRLIVTKVQDLLGELLQKQRGDEPPQEGGATAPPAPTAP
jgi:hypothetical protein